jgi:putative transposase
MRADGNVGSRTAYIRRGDPWGEQPYRKLRPRDELLNGEIFYSLHEAPIVVERWRPHYTASGRIFPFYKPLAPEVS